MQKTKPELSLDPTSARRVTKRETSMCQLKTIHMCIALFFLAVRSADHSKVHHPRHAETNVQQICSVRLLVTKARGQLTRAIKRIKLGNIWLRRKSNKKEHMLSLDSIHIIVLNRQIHRDGKQINGYLRLG